MIHTINLCFIRTGDCLLAVDDIDLLGLKIKDIATLIRNEGVHDVNFSIWRYPRQKDEHDIGLALKGPLPDVARNLANALSGTVYIIHFFSFFFLICIDYLSVKLILQLIISLED